VRRLVSFAEAVYSQEINVEGITARKASDFFEVNQILSAGDIPVLVDPQLDLLESFSPLVMVDARMTKKPPGGRPEGVPLVIGLGPGFTAGEDCDAVVETMRGHSLGRVLWQGQVLANTGIPETVGGRGEERVLRASAEGILITHVSITDQVQQGDLLAEVSDKPLYAPFTGVIRGLLKDGLPVKTGMKVGDLDPRNDPAYCTMISDKSLAIAGGVLEAILSKPEIRNQLYN
jgi:xanthine dehydrogenase accessory factor